MKKQLFLLLAIIFSLNCYSQITFEQGYVIDNTGDKEDVLIKYVDWRTNPDSFQYKISQNAEVRTGAIDDVREFGVYNTTKYVRAKVKIDRSSDNINKLSKVSEPVFREEELFLSVLVEGKATLFQYNDGPLRRYFFNKENSAIRQLIYKRYLIPSVKIGTNNSFRQQLWNDMKCPGQKAQTLSNMEYNREDLVKHFRKYNTCQEAEITFGSKKKKDLFNLNLRPRVNFNSLSITNENTTSRDTDFGNKTGNGLGLEAEFILPFRNNKWSVIFEPTFQAFKKTTTNDQSIVPGGQLITKIDYRALEIPLGMRHYFFLNDQSKIFLNASYIWTRDFEPTIEFFQQDGAKIGTLNINSSNTAGFGLGYKYKDKYSLEVRYYTNKKILGEYRYYRSDYKTISVIAGYSLF